MSFNFMAAVTMHSDFGAQENKVCHCFYFSSLKSSKDIVLSLEVEPGP